MILPPLPGQQSPKDSKEGKKNVGLNKKLIFCPQKVLKY
jgi:hypothetical protein